MIKKRRTFLGLFASGLAFSILRPSYATSLLTPRQMRGPFYPNNIPLDHDNNLVRIKNHSGTAIGKVSYLMGQVLNPLGHPIVNAQIEIWQCDAQGKYKHPRDGGGRDQAFQGYGRTLSGINGEYRFKTIKPVMYPGRTPHIHMRILSKASELITQIYVKGEPLNNRDFILNSIHNIAARNSLIIPFVSDPGYPPDELVAKFNPEILA